MVIVGTRGSVWLGPRILLVVALLGCSSRQDEPRPTVVGSPYLSSGEEDKNVMADADRESEAKQEASSMRRDVGEADDELSGGAAGATPEPQMQGWRSNENQLRQQVALQEAAANLYAVQAGSRGKSKRIESAKARDEAGSDDGEGRSSSGVVGGVEGVSVREAGRFSPARPPVRSAAPADGPATPGEATVRLDEPAQQLLATRSITPGLSYQDATGYWANTYVPGDPTIRLLEARLKTNNSVFVAADGSPLQLDAAARQYAQPFDPPDDSALAVYLHADQRAISGPTRMLLQVGLKATSRQSGLRPSMNVGVVLDLRDETTAQTSVVLRALAQELVAARQTGDRFSITVAGRPGGCVVPAAQFKAGPVAVAMRALFGAARTTVGEQLDLPGAVERAMQLVSEADDPSAQLGASVVLLVTPSRIGTFVEPIERLAHTSAVGGIPMSVIGVGSGVDLDEMDRLTLAGQGNRRVLQSPDEAEKLVDRELHAVSRVVARAVRLRIRLSPGVRLVEMFRSKRLEESRAQWVRDAENSVDLRVARNLGIAADRGDDEEGMQIVIPSFYAGDAHVFLLDVVVERPGSVADVTARYKDLVFLRNGVARDNCSVGTGRDRPGPLERNVLKNMIAVRLSDAIQHAGGLLEQGRDAEAVALLDQQVVLLDGLRLEVAGWARDPELLNDRRMVSEYSSVLRGGAASRPTARIALVDSMRYAGHRKLQGIR